MHDGEVTEGIHRRSRIDGSVQRVDAGQHQGSGPDQHVQAAVHEVNRAHRRVFEAHGVWTQAGNNKQEMIAVCIAFGNLVSSIID
jgi:hypothetical protein